MVSHACTLPHFSVRLKSEVKRCVCQRAHTRTHTRARIWSFAIDKKIVYETCHAYAVPGVTSRVKETDRNKTTRSSGRGNNAVRPCGLHRVRQLYVRCCSLVHIDIDTTLGNKQRRFFCLDVSGVRVGSEVEGDREGLHGR